MDDLRSAPSGLRREVIAPSLLGAPHGARCGVATWIAVAILAGAALRANLAPRPDRSPRPPAHLIGGAR
jgi:hypothetical protein